MDFILFDELAQNFLHLEVAVKFYLFVPNHPSLCSGLFWGPHLKDRLDLKVGKLINKQLGMGSTPVASRLLKAQFGIDTLQSATIIQGALFFPYSRFKILHQHITQLPFLNNNMMCGMWFSVLEFKHYISRLGTSSTKLYLPAKHDYLSTNIEAENCINLDTGIEQISNFSMPRMVFIMHVAHTVKVLQRCFVAPDSWPQLNQAH